jgi:hypothetical protein
VQVFRRCRGHGLMVERDLRKVEMAVRFRLAPNLNKKKVKSTKLKVKSKKKNFWQTILLFNLFFFILYFFLLPFYFLLYLSFSKLACMLSSPHDP